jgi:hypothetical protein
MSSHCKNTSYQLLACDVCPAKHCCSEIFITMRILAADMSYSEDQELIHAIHKLQKHLDAEGFSYPSGQSLCQIARDYQKAIELRQAANVLLKALRHKMPIITDVG